MERKIIGNCLLINGDCYEEIKKIPNNSIDLIHTDPPYLIHANPEDMGNGMLRNKTGSYGMYEKLTEYKICDGFDTVLMFKEFKRICKTINYQIWCNKKQFVDYVVMSKENKWNMQDICLYRNNPLPNCNGKYLDKDYCIHLWKGRKLTGSFDDKKTDYHWSIGGKKEYPHPALKPIEPITHLLQTGSNEDDVVIDPFMGSGTTGVACVQTNRKFIGIEMNKEFYDMAVERIMKEYEKNRTGNVSSTL